MEVIRQSEEYRPMKHRIEDKLYFMPETYLEQHTLISSDGNGTLYSFCDDSYIEKKGVEPVFQYSEETMYKEGTGIMDLPLDIYFIIFKYLDAKSFCQAAGVCRAWREVALNSSLWRERCSTVWNQIKMVVRQNMALASDHISSGLFTSDNVDRMRLLLETLGELNDLTTYRVDNKALAHSNTECYYRMINLLFAELCETKVILIDVRPTSMTVNFDILDLAIRRYMRQITFMFPNGDIKYPACFNRPGETASSLIKDEDAKKLWDKYIGANTYCVNFSYFYTTVMAQNTPCYVNDPLFKSMFAFFVNFPADNMMTPYKWAVIIDQFGPFDEFAENFRKYCSGYGFLGLINCVEAEHLIPSPNMVLLRFSRKEPEKLTFSFKVIQNGNTICRHKRKPFHCPLRKYIQDNFHPYVFSFVRKRIQLPNTPKTLHEYINFNGYCITDDTS